MKTYLLMLVFCLIQHNIKAQCDNLIESKTDKFTGKTSHSTKMIVNTDNYGDTIVFSLTKVETNIYLIIVGVESGCCIKSGSNVTVLFTDKSSIKMTNVKNFNCTWAAQIGFYNYGVTKGWLKKLSELTIDAVRIELSDRVSDVEFEGQQAETIRCLFNTLKNKTD